MTTEAISTIDYGLGFELRDHAFAHLIDGKLVAGASASDVIDPGTGEVVASAPVADAAQVDAAVQAARRASASWHALGWDGRAAIIHAVADVLEQNAEVLARLTTIEQGKPLTEAREDVQWSIDFARHFADMRLDSNVIHDDETSYVEVHHDPLGVVAAICPWNFPLFQAVYKLAPALIAGNTMVLKPSPTTPIATLYLAELIAGVIPAGVFNVIGDAGDVGPYLTQHPAVDKVSFTGSTATGKRVMGGAADGLKRLTLELGGNDAAIVLSDADVAKTAAGLHKFSFANSGQVCVSVKRIYAADAIYDQLVDELARLVSETKVGHGLEPGTQMGPVQNARQFEAAKGYLNLAAEHGNVVVGGAVEDRPGYYVAPTLVRDIVEDNTLLTEETFAPVRSVIRYTDVDDAVNRANASPYGLGASVWGGDIDNAAAVAGRLEAGTTWVNHHFALSPDVPFGGHKQSGLGVEFGLAGLKEFTKIQVLNINRG